MNPYAQNSPVRDHNDGTWVRKDKNINNQKSQKLFGTNEPNLTPLEKDELNLMNTITDLSKKGTTGINKDVNTTTPTTPNNDTDVVEVRYKHKKKSRPLVIANNNTSTTSTLKAEKKILLFATRFDPDTTDEDIKKHIGTRKWKR
ncbi:hypothetical protein Zmor_026954 [Zophobas morio]|uniref:Uncharacterized protein n=1 Tax=Zophobas morio TaxID=2755281 RepID=A0AA38M602_9CUCU|nr:hypothetical protein Zmor_026954 [Zophobas morio]